MVSQLAQNVITYTIDQVYVTNLQIGETESYNKRKYSVIYTYHLSR